MKKSDSDIPRIDLYRKTIVVNAKTHHNLQKSLKDHKNQNDQYL